MSEDLRSHWAALEADLSAALALLDAPLARHGLEDEAERVREYIEHREYGVALEELCSLLHRAGVPLPLDAYRLLARSGRGMLRRGADLDEKIWTMLKPDVE